MQLAGTTNVVSGCDSRTGPHRRYTARRAVTFEVPPGLASHAQLAAEFTSWAPLAMDRGIDGVHRVTISLQVGRLWRYQFILDDERIVNDPNASCFVPGLNGGYVSALRF